MNTTHQFQEYCTLGIHTKRIASAKKFRHAKNRGADSVAFGSNGCDAEDSTLCSKPLCHTLSRKQARGLVAHKVKRAVAAALRRRPTAMPVGRQLNVVDAVTRRFFDMGGSQMGRPSISLPSLTTIIRKAGQYDAGKAAESTVRTYITRLIAFGLLRREQDPRDRRSFLYVWQGPLASDNPKVPLDFWRKNIENWASKAAITQRIAKIDRKDFESQNQETVFQTDLEARYVGQARHFSVEQPQPPPAPPVTPAKPRLKRPKPAPALESELEKPKPRQVAKAQLRPPIQASAQKAVGSKEPQKAEEQDLQSKPEPEDDLRSLMASVRVKIAERNADKTYQAELAAQEQRQAANDAMHAERRARQKSLAAQAFSVGTRAKTAMPAGAGGLARAGVRPPAAQDPGSRAIDPTIVPFLKAEAAHMLGEIDPRYWAREGLRQEHVHQGLLIAAKALKQGKAHCPSAFVLKAALRIRDGMWVVR